MHRACNTNSDFAKLILASWLILFILIEGTNAAGAQLEDYLSGTVYSSRGEWFNVMEWAQASTICDDRPDTVACMACSFDLPKFAKEERLAPLGVYDALWKYPEAGATCGMCLKVWLPEGTDAPECDEANYEKYPHCPGRGGSPWSTEASQPWAWSSPIYRDEDVPYIHAIIVEWYDVDVPHEYGIAYATQGKDPKGMGNWPVQYKAIPCPVHNHTLEYSIVSYGTNVNRYSRKIMIAGQRTPISAVEVLLQDGNWHETVRSGDGFWETRGGVLHELDAPLSLRIWCAGRSTYVAEEGLIPSQMLCRYQDPDCKRIIGKAQC